MEIKVGMTIRETRKILTEMTMQHTGGNIPKAAILLGLHKSNLNRYLKKEFNGKWIDKKKSKEQLAWRERRKRRSEGPRFHPMMNQYLGK